MPEQVLGINLSSPLHKVKQLDLPSWQLTICPSIRVRLTLLLHLLRFKSKTIFFQVR